MSADAKAPYAPPACTDLGSIEGLLGLEPGELQTFRTFYLAHKAERFPPRDLEAQILAVQDCEDIHRGGNRCDVESLRTAGRRLKNLFVAILPACERDVAAMEACNDALAIADAMVGRE